MSNNNFQRLLSNVEWAISSWIDQVMRSRSAAIGVLAGVLMTLSSCSTTHVPVSPAELGVPTTRQAMLASMQNPQGPISFHKHRVATWSVSLAGMLNLDHPRARAAGLDDRMEPIDIYVYSVVHPVYGTYIIDSGVAESFRNPKDNTDVSSLVKAAMKLDQLNVEKTTAELSNELGGIDGVFLSHIHFDHILGLKDLSAAVPVYLGPGDAGMSSFPNLFARGTFNRLLANVETLNEWQFDEHGILDLFGDGSLFAIHVPGHTPGATAYLARTTEGAQLMIGDATHTAWGWENGVEPGSFSDDIPASRLSLQKLKLLAEEVENLTVHPGHQSTKQTSIDTFTYLICMAP